jgi:hypothetical protein
MLTVQVDKLRPVLVPLLGAKSDVVKNIGSVALFYKGGQNGAAVSSSEKDGELAESSTLTIEQPTWFIAKEATGTLFQEPSVTEGIIGSEIVNEAITTAKIAAAAVTTAKLQGAGVTAVKVKEATLPVAGAEKAVVVGTAGVQRKITAVHVGDGAEVKVKVKHSLETFAVNVIAQKGAETKKPGANYLNAAGAGAFTWEPISASEVEITFGTAPIAKFESFITVLA